MDEKKHQSARLSPKKYLKINLLIMLLFASSYYIIMILKPDMFIKSEPPQEANNVINFSFMDAIFFSLSIQSTLGFSDIIPHSSQLKILCALQIVLVMVVNIFT